MEFDVCIYEKLQNCKNAQNVFNMENYIIKYPVAITLTYVFIAQLVSLQQNIYFSSVVFHLRFCI